MPLWSSWHSWSRTTCTLRQDFISLIWHKKLQGKTFSSGFWPKKKKNQTLLAAQPLRTTMLFLSEVVSGPLLSRTSTPAPQGSGAAGRKKVDFKQVPSIMSYWVKCKRLLDPGPFNKTFSFLVLKSWLTEYFPQSDHIKYDWGINRDLDTSPEYLLSNNISSSVQKAMPHEALLHILLQVLYSLPAFFKNKTAHL